MAARAGKGGKAAGWAISLGLHLLFLAMVLLVPAQRLIGPPAIEVRLTPPPDGYSLLQPAPQASVAKASAAPPARAPMHPTTALAPPAAPAALPPVTAPVTAPAPSAPQPASAGSPPAAGGSAGLAGQEAAAAGANVLRQTFGCSSMRAKLTLKEQASCEQRAAERTKDIPDRPGATIPKYKHDYFDAVVATQNSPNHIPGTNCVANIAATQDHWGNVGVAIDVLHPVTCVPEPGAGPKPREASLKDLGLAR